MDSTPVELLLGVRGVVRGGYAYVESAHYDHIFPRSLVPEAFETKQERFARVLILRSCRNENDEQNRTLKTLHFIVRESDFSLGGNTKDLFFSRRISVPQTKRARVPFFSHR